MRASEALILGSTILKPKTHVFDDGVGKGCAMGMMNRAVGGTAVDRKVLGVFRWLSTTNLLYPCGCHHNSRESANTIVIHLFDTHFPLDWTIERIADWLRSVEPTPVEENPVALRAIEAPERLVAK